MDKLFSVDFKIDAKMLTIIYICYEYKFPLSFMLSFYEMYGDTSMFAFKALSCAKKIKLTDSSLIKILDESRILYSQILQGISTIIKINELKSNNPNNEEIPEYPSIDLSKFSNNYRNFIQNYLLVNVTDIYAPRLNLKLSSDDLYKELLD